MPLSALILHLDAARLRILCAIAFLTGLASLFFGFTHAKSIEGQSVDSPRPQSGSPDMHQSIDSIESIPQVIRLSLPPVTTRSTEMSQQQKVAAALMRAGLSNSVGWTDSSSDSENAIIADKAASSSLISELPISTPTRYLDSPAPKQAPASRSRRSKLFLIAGVVLMVASLLLFLRLH